MNEISPLAYVHPDAKIGEGNVIGPFCCINQDTIIGNNNTFYNNVTLHPGARIGSNNEFFPGTSIATKPQDLKYKGERTYSFIGDNNSIRENVTVSRGTASRGKTVIGNGNLLMENTHVAHDCLLGNNLVVGNSTKFGGEVIVDDEATISATVLSHQFCHIGGYVMIQGGSGFSQDIPPYIIAGKMPTHYCGINVIGLRRRGFSNEVIEMIHDTYRIIYSNSILRDGLQEARMKYPNSKEVDYICSFVENSKRGIIR